MYKVEHTGERIMPDGRKEKTGPRVLKTRDNYVTINPGETKEVDLDDDVARITVGLDGGPLKFHLTDEQAEMLNTPVVWEPKPVKTVHGIPMNWKELDWNARRALAVSLVTDGTKVTSGEVANAIISSAFSKHFRIARRERKISNDIRSAHRS